MLINFLIILHIDEEIKEPELEKVQELSDRIQKKEKHKKINKMILIPQLIEFGDEFFWEKETSN